MFTTCRKKCKNTFNVLLKTFSCRNSFKSFILKTHKISFKAFYSKKGLFQAENAIVSCFINKLRLQTQSDGLSDNWTNQSLESLLLFVSWWNFSARAIFNHKQPYNLVPRAFSLAWENEVVNPRVSHCAQRGDNFLLLIFFFSWSWWSKMGKTRKSKLKQIGGNIVEEGTTS